jgi:hypothetical protein
LKTRYQNGFIKHKPNSKPHSKPQLGKPHNETTKKKISDTLKGRKLSQAAIDKRVMTAQLNRNRKIIQLDIHGNKLNEFDSCKEAAEYVGGASSNISSCCHGRGYNKTAKGYVWKYESIVE